MKPEIPVIMRISPGRPQAWRVLEHFYGEGDHKPERDITTRIVPGHFRLEAGFPIRDPHFDSRLLLARHHGRGKEVRHLIFSTQEMPGASNEEYMHALAGVVAVAKDFLAKVVHNHDFILQPHADRIHPHCHVALCSSDGSKCVDWKPKDLIGFQGMDFVTSATREQFNIVSGRGRGQRPVDVGRVAYDSAVKHEFHSTVERKTADALNYELILNAIQSGELEVTRRTKAGKPLSVRLDGKTVRLSTLRKATIASKQTNTDDKDDSSGSPGVAVFARPVAPTPTGPAGVAPGTTPTTGGPQRRYHRGPAAHPKTPIRGR